MFLGLLAVFGVDQFGARVGDTQKALSVYKHSKRLGDAWTLIWQFCALAPSSLETVSVGAGSGGAAANNLSLMAGRVAVSATYARCYSATGLRSMSAVMPGAAGAETFLNFPVTWQYTTVNGSHGVAINYAKVPDNVLLPLYRKYSRVAAAASTYSLAATATNTTDTAVRFTAATGGLRTMTLLHPL